MMPEIEMMDGISAKELSKVQGMQLDGLSAKALSKVQLMSKAKGLVASSWMSGGLHVGREHARAA
jgi:hypothetical protein